MGGRLMMCMMPRMLDGLCLGQDADGQDAQDQKQRDDFEDGTMHKVRLLTSTS